MAKLDSYDRICRKGKTQVLIKARIIVWNLKNDDRKYAMIYPIRAPFSVFRMAF